MYRVVHSAKGLLSYPTCYRPLAQGVPALSGRLGNFGGNQEFSFSRRPLLISLPMLSISPSGTSGWEKEWGRCHCGHHTCPVARENAINSGGRFHPKKGQKGKGSIILSNAILFHRSKAGCFECQVGVRQAKLFEGVFKAFFLSPNMHPVVVCDASK